MKQQRWYDQYKKLSKHLLEMQGMNVDERDRLVAGIATILNDRGVNLSFGEVFAFPLEFPRRRWYDQDPYMWLIMNGLQGAEKSVVEEVEEFLENQMEL